MAFLLFGASLASFVIDVPGVNWWAVGGMVTTWAIITWELR